MISEQWAENDDRHLKCAASFKIKVTQLLVGFAGGTDITFVKKKSEYSKNNAYIYFLRYIFIYMDTTYV